MNKKTLYFIKEAQKKGSDNGNTIFKKSPKTSSTDDTKTTGIVQDLLKDIETTKEQGCIDLTKNLISTMEK